MSYLYNYQKCVEKIFDSWRYIVCCVLLGSSGPESGGVCWGPTEGDPQLCGHIQESKFFPEWKNGSVTYVSGHICLWGGIMKGFWHWMLSVVNLNVKYMYCKLVFGGRLKNPGLSWFKIIYLEKSEYNHSCI